MSENTSASSPVSGDSAVLVDRYIGALFSLAEQEGVVEAVVSDMLNLRTLWNESPEWRFVACDPRLNHEKVTEVANQVAVAAGVSKVTANFLSIVAQNRRLSLLPLLINGYMEEVGTRRGEFRADVRVAHPLTADQKEKLTAILSAATGGKVRLAMVEDPSILGGLTVKIRSQYLDSSIKTKLDRMERALRRTNAAT
ncbi:MAG: ATP synthase F1 subunit delta [Bdellovibrionales bacterium]